MNTTISQINAEIAKRLAGKVVANNVALNFLLKSQEAVISLISWMENFKQELSSAGQSLPTEVWLLVCSCVRRFFQQLVNVRAPASASSDDAAVQTGAYIWAIAQTRRVSNEFISLQWCSHSSIAGIINYHVFKFMVPLSSHFLLKKEIVSLRKADKDRQSRVVKTNHEVSEV